MSFGDFKASEQLKEVLNEGESVPDLQIQLNALTIRFAEMSDEYRLLDDDEQKVRECEYLQLQYQYHDIAMVMLTKLLDPMFIGKEEPTAMDVELKTSVESLSESSPIDSMEPEQSATSNGLNSMNEQANTIDPMEESATALDASAAEQTDGAQSLALQQHCAKSETTWGEIVASEQKPTVLPPPPYLV